MPNASVKVRLPLLARLVLSELAERRGEDDEGLLADLIRQAAVTEMCRESANRKRHEEEAAC